MHHEQAIKQRADYIDARLRFANLLAEVGKGGRAAVSGSAAASAWLRRGSQQLRNAVGECERNKSRGALPRRLASFTKLCRGPQQFGDLVEREGRFAASRGALLGALRLRPRDPQTNYNFALFCRQKATSRRRRGISSSLKSSPPNRP